MTAPPPNILTSANRCSNNSGYELDLPNLPQNRGNVAHNKVSHGYYSQNNHNAVDDNDDEMFEFNPREEDQDHVYGNLTQPSNRHHLANDVLATALTKKNSSTGEPAAVKTQERCAASSTKKEGLQCYTQIRRSQVLEEDVYDAPTEEEKTSIISNINASGEYENTEFLTGYNRVTENGIPRNGGPGNGSSGSGGPGNGGPGSGGSSYKSSESGIPRNTSIDNGSLESGNHDSDISPRGSDAKVPAWTERKTLYRKYMMMKMVGMDDTCCCTKSHKGARICCMSFFLFVLLFLFASAGIALGVQSRKFLQNETTMLNTELDSHAQSVTRCQVGRNWTSLPRINSKTNFLRRPYRDEAGTVNMSLNPLLDSAQTSPYTIKQVLLYLVVRTTADNTTDSAFTTTSTPTTTTPSTPTTTTIGSYINIALWTNSNQETPFGQSFLKYMSVLNVHPQITSENYWLPLQGSMDTNIYISAEMLGESTEEQFTPIDITVYLIGYC